MVCLGYSIGCRLVQSRRDIGGRVIKKPAWQADRDEILQTSNGLIGSLVWVLNKKRFYSARPMVSAFLTSMAVLLTSSFNIMLVR